MRNRIVKGVFWLASAKAFGQVLTWVVSIFVVRLLSPQDYGLMGMAVLFTGFLLLFNELGLGAAIIQKSDLKSEQISSLRWVIFWVNVALFLILLVTAPLIARYFNEPALVPIIRVIGLAFVMNGIGTPSGYLLQRDMEFKKKAAAELFGNLAGALSTLGFATTGYGVWSLVFGYLTLQLTTSAMYWFYAPPVASRAFSVRDVVEFVNMGFQVAFSRVLWYVSSSVDLLIVGRLLGSTQLGYYSLAVQFSSLPIQKLVTLITQVAFPSFSAMQHDNERLRRSYLDLVSAVALITFPLFLGLALIAEDAVLLFLTSKWQPIVVPLQILCIASCFRAVENLNAPLVLAKGQPAVLVRNSLLQAVVMPVAFYMGARFGLVGVAMSWLITRPGLFVIMGVWSGRVVELSFWKYVGGLAHATAGSLAMVIVVILCRRFVWSDVSPAVDLALTCAIGASTYAAYNVVFNQEIVKRALHMFRLRRGAGSLQVSVDAIQEKSESYVAAAGRDDRLSRGPLPSVVGRILIASYHFPPDAAVGGLRIAKFARLLPEFGWEPHVLTIRDHLREETGVDYGRLKGLEAVSIVRTRELPRVVEAPGRLKSVLMGRRSANGAAPASSAVAHHDGRRETLGARLKRYFASLFVLLPDEKKNWSLYAAVAAIVLIRRRKIDWVLTSGPPFSVHVIGLTAKMFTRAKWVADFRDPWIDMLPDRFPHTRSLVSDRFERWMESTVVRHADSVLTTTERMRNAMAARYPSLPVERFVCVPNSIDTDTFQSSGGVEKYEPLTITYAGNLYFDRTPEPLFRAVNELVSSGRASKQDIRIKLVGNCRDVEGVETRLMTDRYALNEVVEIIDRVPYAQAVRIMQQSHLLLVLAPERHRLVIPAKIYDYLGSGTKILALAEPGATAELMDETQCGRCFSQADVQGLREYLFELLRDRSYKDLRNQPELFSRFDARVLTGRLVAEMTHADGRLRDEIMVRT